MKSSAYIQMPPEPPKKGCWPLVLGLIITTALIAHLAAKAFMT